MKRIINIIVIALLFISDSWAQPVTYKVGEKVNYTIHYGLITGGIASLELKSDTLNGKEVWHSKLLAKTTGVADAIFKVLDIYESYMDPVTRTSCKVNPKHP